MDDKNLPILIIINGASATGKTTIGRQLSQKLKLPIICKDDIKESMFDQLGWSDIEWSKKLGTVSIKILWHIAGELLSVGKSVIVETKFDSLLATEDVKQLLQKYDFKTLQFLCWAKGEFLLKRFRERALTSRHPGHCDKENLDLYKAELLKEKLEPIKINGKTLEIDTSDFTKIDYNFLVQEIKTELKK